MPSTAADLLARIEATSSAILQQKNVLKDLEKAKSELQRQLNAVRDPVSHLPLELLSQIFLHCRPDDELPTPSHNAAPMVFLNVSHAWSDIALATPTLWSSVKLNVRSAYHDGSPELLKLWFERAGTSLLAVALNVDLEDDWKAVRHVVHTNADRIRDLELSLADAALGELVDGTNYPTLKSLVVTFLNFDRVAFNTDYRSADACAKIVSAAPNLEQCTIQGCLRSWDFVGHIHTAQALRHLRLGSNEWGSTDRSVEFLRFVNLPALQTLSLQFDRHPAELLDCLSRSLPSLQSLDVHFPPADWSVSDVERLCRLFPSLRSLGVRCRAEMAGHFIQVLADGELPNLQNISLGGPLNTDQHTSLISMLTARRARLRTFCWVMAPRGCLPDLWVLTALRELAAGGMQVRVGSESELLG